MANLIINTTTAVNTIAAEMYIDGNLIRWMADAYVEVECTEHYAKITAVQGKRFDRERVWLGDGAEKLLRKYPELVAAAMVKMGRSTVQIGKDVVILQNNPFMGLEDIFKPQPIQRRVVIERPAPTPRREVRPMTHKEAKETLIIGGAILGTVVVVAGLSALFSNND